MLTLFRVTVVFHFVTKNLNTACVIKYGSEIQLPSRAVPLDYLLFLPFKFYEEQNKSDRKIDKIINFALS